MKALSDTLHSVSLGPSMSLQMPHFHFFSWLSNVPLQALVTSLSVHLSMDIKVLPCPVVHSTAINIRVHISFRIMVFYRQTPRSGISGSHGSSILYSTLYSTQCFLLFSKVNQPCVYIYISPLLWISFPFRSSQSTE